MSEFLSAICEGTSLYWLSGGKNWVEQYFGNYQEDLMVEFWIEMVGVSVKLWRKEIGVCFPHVDQWKIMYVRHDLGVARNPTVTYLRVILKIWRKEENRVCLGQGGWIWAHSYKVRLMRHERWDDWWEKKGKIDSMKVTWQEMNIFLKIES